MKLQVAYQLVGRVGKEALETVHEGVDVTATHLFDKVHYLERQIARRKRSIIGQQEFGETLFHFLIWETQFIGPELPVVPLNGQITALVEDGDRIRVHGVDAPQRIGRSHLLGQAVQIVLTALEQFHKESWCARLKPVAAELHLGKCIKQAKRVVDILAIFHEVVSVVLFFQLLFGFVLREMVLLGQHCDVFLEIAMQFAFRNAAYAGKPVVDGDVHQIVQVAEHADLAELCHPCQQGKAEVFVTTLQHTVEGFQCVAVVGEQGFVADGL